MITSLPKFAEKEIQELRELTILKHLARLHWWQITSKAEGGKDGKEEEGEVRRVENEVMIAILTGRIESTRGDVASVVC